jgi:hypothetical protein
MPNDFFAINRQNSVNIVADRNIMYSVLVEFQAAQLIANASQKKSVFRINPYQYHKQPPKQT